MNATEEIKSMLDQLVEDGKTVQELINGQIATPDFIEAYQQWYTPALKLVSLLGTDRFEEFCSYYLVNPSRDQLNASTYVIQDYVSGVKPVRSIAPGSDFHSQTIITSKFASQLGLLKSLSIRIDSVLSDVKGHLFAELQDKELRVASQLIEVNLRAAGAVAGVVLEGHLQQVAANHGISIAKKNPTVSDLNNPLKENGVYDIVLWRRIQYLADIRNCCDHKKEREPTEEEVKDLIAGADKIIKTIF
jgi:hypothetical protein